MPGLEGAMHMQGQSGGVLGHEETSPCFLPSGFHGDLDVLAEGGEKVHETFDGKGTGALRIKMET